MLTFLRKLPKICSFVEDGKEMYKKVKTHVQSDCFCSLNPLFCSVLVAIAVLFAKLKLPFENVERRALVNQGQLDDRRKWKLMTSGKSALVKCDELHEAVF